MKAIFISLCALATLWDAHATSPSLSFNLVSPGVLQFSWSTNYTNWQLASVTNITSTNWKAITQAAFLSNNLFTILIPTSNKSSFFRLQQTNSGGGCVFQATPPVITSGAMSVLSWCTVAGTTYRVTPGPGVVSGGNLTVSPTVTTTYTLTASNSLGIVTNFATVIVNPCGFASVSNWNGTINFNYTLAPSSGPYSFNINQSAQITFRLTRTGGTDSAPQYQAIPGGTSSINNTENDSSSGSTITTTEIGSGAPQANVSFVLLAINCASNSYEVSANVGINTTETVYSSGPPSVTSQPDNSGLFVAGLYSLPTNDSSITFSGTLPCRGPFWTAGGSYYETANFVADDMFLNGVVTDTTAGNVSISWTFTPAP